MKTLSRVGAWLLVAAIVVLTVVPPDYRPITPLPHNGEHVGIFLAAGLVFGLGYETRRLLQAAGMVIFSAVIEIVQLYVPGRHARLSDFVVDAVSAGIGTGLAAAVMQAKRKLAK